MSRVLIVLVAVAAAAYFFGDLVTPWFDYRSVVARIDLSTVGVSSQLTTVWSVLTHRAVAVTIGDDSVRFDLSWFGVIIVVTALLFLRLFRR